MSENGTHLEEMHLRKSLRGATKKANQCWSFSLGLPQRWVVRAMQVAVIREGASSQARF